MIRFYHLLDKRKRLSGCKTKLHKNGQMAKSMQGTRRNELSPE
jgi:hypothetical protein